ncbi:MAG: FAD-dependent monooxygenase, partial [Pseudonocardiaceae bacterium]
MGAGRWGFIRERRADGAGSPQQRWAVLLRTATGFPDLQPEILGAVRYTMAADVASTYRAGPGFLVGDAAHRMTPFGGVGMNTAIHDGHELGWRLAWAVRGLAGDGLLDSYAAEREPVGRANAVRSLREERDPADGLPRDLGGTYRSPVIADDGAPAAVGHHRTARPGERAPHVWLRSRGRRVSTLDLFENRLTVLAGPDGDGWDRGLPSVRPAGVPIEVLRRCSYGPTVSSPGATTAHVATTPPRCPPPSRPRSGTPSPPPSPSDPGREERGMTAATAVGPVRGDAAWRGPLLSVEDGRLRWRHALTRDAVLATLLPP